MLNYPSPHNFFPQETFLKAKTNCSTKKARMMQQYDFSSTDTFSSAASTSIQPSEQTLQNIRSFARSYQTVVVDGVKVEFYLN